MNACGFWYDDDPSSLPQGPSGPVPPVIVVPGRETPDVSQLLDLPIEPDSVHSLDLEPNRNELRTDTGYVRTWPAFMEPRQQRRIGWTAQTTANKDTLMAFFAANVIWRWTPPRGALTAFASTSRPTAQGDGKIWRLEITVTELKQAGV